MNKAKMQFLRDAIADKIPPEELVGILDMSSEDILEYVSNEDLLDFYEDITDAMPDFDINSLRELD